jgi:hypothetical protein
LSSFDKLRIVLARRYITMPVHYQYSSKQCSSMSNIARATPKKMVTTTEIRISSSFVLSRSLQRCYQIINTNLEGFGCCSRTGARNADAGFCFIKVEYTTYILHTSLLCAGHRTLRDCRGNCATGTCHYACTAHHGLGVKGKNKTDSSHLPCPVSALTDLIRCCTLELADILQYLSDGLEPLLSRASRL